MKDSSTEPRFRLLIHGQDGSIPYLTPELLRLMFFPEETDNHQLEDGKLNREIILGLAVKDTCITPDYQDKPLRTKKRKGGSTVEEENVNTHVAKLNDDVSSIQNSSDGKDSNRKIEQQQQQQQQHNKKPTGYSFLNKQKSSRICGLLNGAQDNSTAEDSNYMEKYLRTPHYLKTLIVPTFSFVNNDATVNSSKEENKYTPKKQEAKQSQQKICSGSNNVIPKSTKGAVSIETPHGWQSIQPEEYCDAVSSMTVPTKSSPAPNSCEGAVGLFDHVDLSAAQSDSLFSVNTTVKNCDEEECETSSTTQQARKQALKKITMSLQKSNDWACRSQRLFLNEAQPTKLWLPVQILASQLPKHVLFTTPKIRPNIEKKIEDKEQKLLSNHSNVAIIGWDALVCGNKQRRDVLRHLMDSLQSASTNPKQFLLLAVNDLQSILDAAREGVSIIGSDMARLCSRNGIALCFDFRCDDSICGKEMDLKETQFARDFDPILSKCTCLTCRPRKTGKAPSFTRAYIHHLIQAKEMLAEILLFTHNLHQLILLFRQLSEAAASDEGKEEKVHLETFCRKIEHNSVT